MQGVLLISGEPKKAAEKGKFNIPDDQRKLGEKNWLGSKDSNLRPLDPEFSIP